LVECVKIVERSAGQRLADDVGEMLREQHDYRELLYQMTRRDLLLRYKQTVMGFGWARVHAGHQHHPLLVVFMRVAQIDVGVPYPLFAYTGLLAGTSSPRAALLGHSLTANINLSRRSTFPREIFPFSAVIVSAVDFASARCCCSR
jgi:ABC-type polysaccharide/polyol phosphate export permease